MNKNVAKIILAVGGVLVVLGIVLFLVNGKSDENKKNGDISVDDELVQKLAKWVNSNGECPQTIIKNEDTITVDNMGYKVMYALAFRQFELDGKIDSAYKISKTVLDDAFVKVFGKTPLYTLKYVITYDAVDYTFFAIENSFLGITRPEGKCSTVYPNEVYKSTKNGDELVIYIKEKQENIDVEEWHNYKYTFKTNDNGKNYYLYSLGRAE